MLTRRLRRFPTSLGIAYDTWLLNQAKRRWARHGSHVITVPSWARAKVAQYLWSLNVEFASERWASRTAEVSLPQWQAAMTAKGPTRIPETEVKRWRWLVHGAPDDQ